MKIFKMGRIVLLLLLLANLGWMCWNLSQSAGLRAGDKLLKVEVLRTNGVSGIGIVDVRSGQPLWVKWDGKPDKESYYFRGEHVFDIWWRSNRQPVYGVLFRGPGKSVTFWQNRGGAGTFTERTFYDTNGVLAQDEILYNDSWHAVVREKEKNGIIVDGKWRQLGFDANGMWTIEAANTNRF